MQNAEATSHLKETSAPAPDATPVPHSADPADSVSPGIEPVSLYLPKGAPSHPTPPPEPPVDSVTDVDAVMEDAPDAVGSNPNADAKPEVVHEPNGVSFVEGSQANGVDQNSDVSAVEPEAAQATQHQKPARSPSDPPASDQVVGVVRAREEDPEADEHRVKRTRTDGVSSGDVMGSNPEAPVDDDRKIEQVAEENTAPTADASTTAPEAPNEVAHPQRGLTPAEGDVRPSTETAAPATAEPAAVPTEPDGAAAPTPSSSSEVQYCTQPMTAPQKIALVEKMKNLKKTRTALLFAKPVDYVTLNIPNYPTIIKQPMDLSTMESKLKADQYANVQELVNDFDLILANTRTFNGPDHPVTQQGMSMNAYFRKTMQGIPSPNVQLPAKSQKKRSPPVLKAPSRRESRSVIAAPSPSAATANGTGLNSVVAVSGTGGSGSAGGTGGVGGSGGTGRETFALQPDGTPQIRRDSTMNRPTRAIKPPANREVTYPKPKRKEHQLELKFCEDVLDTIRSPKYGMYNSAFLVPVDPVALNIPHYRQVVKNPMDLGTMAQKLKTGQYGKAGEFQKDFELMVQNCLAFNPPGNPVRDMAIHLKREFATLWANKAKWEKQHQPTSQRESPASGEDSEEDEDEDEEDQPDDANEQTIAKLSQQLLEIQKALAGTQMKQNKKAAKEKSKASKKAKKPTIPLAKPAKPAPKKKAPKPRQVTYDEKQEISSAVERMDARQVERLTQIITDNCKKYADMGDDMELEIDDLPNDVQLLLLKHVRSIFGKPQTSRASPDDVAAADDDDFEPERLPRGGGAKGSAKKKHKPMGKKEQIDKISSIKQQLAQYEDPGRSTSPGNAGGGGGAGGGGAADSSGDDSEESEEE